MVLREPAKGENESGGESVKCARCQDRSGIVQTRTGAEAVLSWSYRPLERTTFLCCLLLFFSLSTA